MSNEQARTLRPAERVEENLGRYQIVAPLGQGGMGTIYLALAAGPADFRKLLVVKELRSDLSANHRFVEMFLDEAKLAARLNHPNVVQTLEAGQQGERYFLSMEFLDGQPFSAIWQNAKTSSQITLPIQLKIICDALAGLHYAHSLTEYDGTKLDIVHRDVSPQNIFVTYDGQVKVVDFGIAKAAVSSTLTTPGVFKGKFGYAAPEQLRGESVDARTDVFAMGVVLWEALAMQRFSDGVVTRDSLSRRLTGKEPRLSQMRLALKPRLIEICDRALAVDPDARFASADEFRAALDAFMVQDGQRVEPALLKRVLEDEFNAERKTVHRLIDRHIKHGPAESSRVMTVTLGSEAGNNQPTQVADLSLYAHTTAEHPVSGDVASQPITGPADGLGRRLLIGVAAVLVVAGASYAGMQLTAAKRLEAAPPPVAVHAAPAPTSPNPPSPPSAASAQPAPVRPHVAQPEPRAAALPPPEPEPAADVEHEPQVAPDTALDQPADDGRSVTGRLRTRRLPHSRATGAPAATGVDSAPAASPIAAPVAPQPALAPSQPAKPSVGSDLNRIEKVYKRRSIDTDL